MIVYATFREKPTIHVTYTAHVQKKGDLPAVSDGKQAGTTGEARRLEAIQMRLTGKPAADGYHVWYRVHSQTYGWLGWACDGASAGTEGLAKRAEAVDIQILPKGAPAPGSTANAFRTR